MTQPPGHDELQELLGAYALDAVDDDERARLEDHLRDCPRCRDEVAQHREVAGLLAWGGAPAPPGLWDRISTALGGADASPSLAAVYPLRDGRPRGRRWPLVAAAAAVVVVLGALSWQVHRQDRQIAQLRAGLAGSGVARAAAAAFADPKAATLVLASSDGRTAVAGVLEPDGSGFLLPAAALPALGVDRTYQLWGIVGDRRISLGVLGASPGVVAFRATVPGLTALAITSEQAGGAVQPTGAPVVSGAVHRPV